MSTLPLVSIITPCYNGANYLDGYFKGILSQYHKNIELIFVNDGSTDKTEEVALKYGEEMKQQGMQFVYIYQENSGQACAMNKGLVCFKGDYLMWLDADDILMPDNISKKLFFLQEHKDCGMVLNEIQLVDESDLEKKIGSIKRIKPSGEDKLFEDLLLCRNVVFVPGIMLVRRKCVMEAIPSLHIYESREGQNWQMLLPLAYHYKCGYIEEELLKCVSHSDSHSKRSRTIDEQFARKNNFISICSETVRNIPEITEQEKEKWCQVIRVFHNKNKLEIAGNSLNYRYFLTVKKELLLDGYSLKSNERYVNFFMKKIKRKLCMKVCKIKNNFYRGRE